MSLREWSGVRILLLSSGWVVVSLALLVWYTSRLLKEYSAKTGSGIVAISGGILEPLIFLFGPPVLLTVVWLVFRRPS